MKKTSRSSSPSTLTPEAQARALLKAINAFIVAQQKANQALAEINTIALLENEGNPFTSAPQSTEALVDLALIGNTTICPYVTASWLNDRLSEMERLKGWADHWASY